MAKPSPIRRMCMICDRPFFAEWGRRANGPWCASEICDSCERRLKKKAQ